ncbi:hypothetical protein [Bacillus cereus]|uniref:hypothetical protein n=1 Tax=Bacillus cereus TaxID=1396 RepID=UPI000BFD2A29|nr:hypothetical protein [Bacillus cereus]PGR83457.1 hypothetical protein COC63_05595 [Bacillus cereus]
MGEMESIPTYSITLEFGLMGFLVVVEMVWVGFLGSLLFGYHMNVIEVALLSVVGYIGYRREQFFELLVDMCGKNQKG